MKLKTLLIKKLLTRVYKTSKNLFFILIILLICCCLIECRAICNNEFIGWKFENGNKSNLNQFIISFKSPIMRDFININQNIGSYIIHEGIISLRNHSDNKFISSNTLLVSIFTDLGDQKFSISLFPNSLLKVKKLEIIPLLGRFKIENKCNILKTDDQQIKKNKNLDINRFQEYKYLQPILVKTTNSIIFVESGTILLEIDMNKNLRVANVDGACTIRSIKSDKTYKLKSRQQIDLPFYDKPSKPYQMNSIWNRPQPNIYNLFDINSHENFYNQMEDNGENLNTNINFSTNKSDIASPVNDI